jgi:hypothetical protein
MSVNAIIWDLLPPRNSEEAAFAVSYFRQIHYLYKFQKVFVQESVFSAVSSEIRSGDKYIQPLPIITNEDKHVINSLKKQLDSYLWAKKKSDVLEVGLTPFLVTVEVWKIAEANNAMIIVPFSNPTSAFSALLNLLVGDRRTTIGCLSEDIELWLFSHFADLSGECPFFYDFNLLLVSETENAPAIRKCQREFCELRDLYLFDAEERVLKNYEEKLAKFQISQRQMLDYVSQRYGKRIVTTEVFLAPSKENIKMVKAPTWKCDSFSKAIKKVKRGDSFTPYFMNLSFYPFELLKSLREPVAANIEVNPVVHLRSFEIASKSVLNLALLNYRKRINP